jgi:predicted site-specific integrase-resolvase
MENKQWITAKEALAILQITSRTTLYKYLYRFNIRVSKPLGRLYINYSDLMDGIERKAIKMGV